jgi:hypothetical protein
MVRHPVDVVTGIDGFPAWYTRAFPVRATSAFESAISEQFGCARLRDYWGAAKHTKNYGKRERDKPPECADEWYHNYHRVIRECKETVGPQVHMR